MTSSGISLQIFLRSAIVWFTNICPFAPVQASSYQIDQFWRCYIRIFAIFKSSSSSYPHSIDWYKFRLINSNLWWLLWFKFNTQYDSSLYNPRWKFSYEKIISFFFCTLPGPEDCKKHGLRQWIHESQNQATVNWLHRLCAIHDVRFTISEKVD